MNFVPFLVIIIIGISIARYATTPLIIFFHELGHAIAYLILTDSNNIDVYVGSYGDKKSKLNFKAGKLHFHINPTFSLVSGGMCSSDKMVDNYIKKIAILLAGP